MKQVKDNKQNAIMSRKEHESENISKRSLLLPYAGEKDAPW